MEELMAQSVEVLSVFAADRRLKEPRAIPRPSDTSRGPKQEQQRQAQAATHGGLLTAAAMRGRVMVTAP